MEKVLFETDDPLNEANLGEFIAHQNNRDYIDEHPTVNANWSANELGLGSSRSWLFFDDRLYTVLPDSETVTLPNSDGENFVFVTFDPEARDSPEYVAAESEGDVSNPKLLLFVADTSTETVDPRNASPDIDVATLEAVAASVESEPTDATDVARKAETDALDAAKADTPHDLAGDDHSEDTLENLNSKVSDADLATDPHGNENHDPNFAEDPHGEESHTAEVLHDGQDFDGQNTSELKELSNLTTENATLTNGTIETEAFEDNDIPQFGQVQDAAGVDNIVQQEEPDIEPAGTLWTQFANPFTSEIADSAIQSGVEVSDGLVFFGSDDNNFYAVDIADGTEEWSFTTGGRVESGVAVSDGLVFFGSNDNNFYAVDISDGTEEWSFSTGDEIQSGVEVSDGLVFFGSFDNNFYAVDITDGTEEWSFEAGDDIQSGVAVSDELVFFGSRDENLYAVDISDGTEEWSFTAGGRVESGVEVSDGLVFAGERFGDNNFYAVDIADGTEEWSFSTGDDIHSGVAVSDELVFFGSEDENLYALNISDGTEEWSFEISQAIISDVVIFGGLVFFTEQFGDRSLYALNIADGTEEWLFDEADNTGGIAASTGLVFVSSISGQITSRVYLTGSGRRSSIMSVSDGDKWVAEI